MTPSGSLSADFSSRIARLMVYIVLCLVLMTLDFRGRWVEQIRAGATLVAEPIWLLVEAPATLSRHLAERFRDRTLLLAEREQLERDLARSEAELLELDELQRENDRLRRLLDAAAALDRDYQTVELRQLDLNPYSHRLLINRGAREGLRVGQAVMDSNGLVGQVDEVLVHSASVILLSDPDHALPIEIERSRLRTIAYGSGREGELRLTDLPMNADIEVGDVVLSSGLGGRFQPGLPVADITEVSRLPGEAFATATAILRARMQGARHLLVITRSSVETLPLTPAADVDVDGVPVESSEPAPVVSGEAPGDPS